MVTGELGGWGRGELPGISKDTLTIPSPLLLLLGRK